LVEGNPDLTVSQLAQNISQTNKYSLPSKTQLTEIPDTIAGYAEQVKNGKLLMQCVGSSNFMKLSLENAFGIGSAGVIGGTELPSHGRRISAIGHQQTTFVDPETSQQYILDATSSSNDIAFIRESVSASLQDLRKAFSSTGRAIENRKAPIVAEATDGVQEVLVNEKASEEVKIRLLEKNKSNLISQLRMMYGAEGVPLPEQRLYETIVKRGANDLIYRTIQITSRAARGDMQYSEAKQTLQYLQSLRASTDEGLLFRLDPNNYQNQPQLLRTLESTLTQIILTEPIVVEEK
jgi:hypothetical protein